MIFADSFKKQNNKSLVEAKEAFIKDSTTIKIQDELDIINKNIHKIGKLGSITLAIRIVVRDAHMKVNQNTKKDLHLLSTHYPEKENIYVHMLDRIA